MPPSPVDSSRTDSRPAGRLGPWGRRRPNRHREVQRSYRGNLAGHRPVAERRSQRVSDRPCRPPAFDQVCRRWSIRTSTDDPPIHQKWCYRQLPEQLSRQPLGRGSRIDNIAWPDACLLSGRKHNVSQHITSRRSMPMRQHGPHHQQQDPADVESGEVNQIGFHAVAFLDLRDQIRRSDINEASGRKGNQEHHVDLC